MLTDNFGRAINYLRVSVTDRCNLRCVYCRPAQGVELCGSKEMLSYEEMLQIVKVGADLGIRRVRITGGEPLARKGIVNFVAQLRNIKNLEEITMTTNGMFLADFAKDLKDAGLARVNISLDTLNPKTFRAITRGGDIERVWQSIHAAETAGLTPIKLNVVLLRGVNDHEILRLAELTERGYEVRFIELMPVGSQTADFRKKFFPAAEAKTILGGIKPLTSIQKNTGAGPSSYFRWGDSPGLIGFIAAITCAFCKKCNRLRLTNDGKLKLCLYQNDYLDLQPVLRRENSEERIADAFIRACALKPKRYHFAKEETVIAMSTIGG